MQAEERAGLVQRLRTAANGQIFTDYGRGTRPLAPEARPAGAFLDREDVRAAADELERMGRLEEAAREVLEWWDDEEQGLEAGFPAFRELRRVLDGEQKGATRQ